MPDVPLERAITSLTEAFGADWLTWDQGIDGEPGTFVFVQAKSNADGGKVLTGLAVVGDGIRAEALRRIPVREIERIMAEIAAGTEETMRAELAKLPPLKRDDLSSLDFSRLVAEHYKVWARHVAKPAASMAQEWDVKSNTMHSWIRDARLRGLLPEAERGKRARG